MSTLYVYASEREAGPLRSDPRVAPLGVGKTAAAAALARRLAMRPPSAVIAFGVAGTYPEASARLPIGATCLVIDDVFGDEGVATPQGFIAMADLGLADAAPLSADAALVARVAAALDEPPQVRGATVSTCSGTDARASELYARTRADVETMEGAAIGWACGAAGVPWVAVRTISNRTGDRDRAGWDLPVATAAIQAAVRRLWDAGI